MPKALRHFFGVVGFKVPFLRTLVQRWLGHASLETTVAGNEEREFASRIWRSMNFGAE
jgi:integrase/recombinase XerD